MTDSSVETIDIPYDPQQPVIRANIECDKELGSWTVRLNGHYLWDSWSEVKARRLAMKLNTALSSLGKDN